VSAAQSPAPVSDGSRAQVFLDGVSVFYGEVVGLSRVSLTLSPGITGIVGPNGSGKTTMMRVLTGLLGPREGRVTVFGGSPFFDAETRSRISLVPAESSFFDGLSARKNLEVAFLSRGKTGSEAKELADQALEMVRLTSDGNRRYGILSRGMRQRVKLGLTLISDAELVLLDEPFLGVDPPSRKQLRDIILQLGASGRTVLVSSHVLHEVEALTDRVGVLASGRLLGFGKVETLLRDIRDQYPQRLFVHVDDPRALGTLLLRLPHVMELKITGEHELEFVTEHPETAFRELPGLVVSSGTLVKRLEALDNTLETVFTHVTSVGTHRL
jgi:ABC-2 type transport system ATP-binding protein